MDALPSTSDLHYATHDGRELKGDLFLPDGHGPFPLLITVPGGAWRQCNRRNHWPWARFLALKGIAIFVCEYRVASFDRKAFPESVKDVAAAVRFARSGRIERVDRERVALLGSSAGAHLAALVAVSDQKRLFGADLEPALNDERTDVNALIGVYGIYDLFLHWQKDLRANPDPRGNVTRNLLGMDPFEDQQVYFDASPLRHLSYSKNKTPVLLAWGTNDDAVSPTQSEIFLEALQQARFDVRACRLLGATHFWFNQSPEIPGTESAFFAPRLLAFLGTHL